MRKTLILGIGCFALVLWWTPVAGEAETIYAVTSTNALLTFDSATPGTTTSVAITGLQSGESILGIDLRPATGQLYGLGSTSRLYTINPATGVATQVGSGPFTPALSGTSFGFDFNPTVDRIRLVSDADQNLRLDPVTGAVAGIDTNLAYATGDPNQGANPNVVASAYTNNFAGATSTTLFEIDSNLDIGLIQGSPGGTPISPNTGQLFSALPIGVNTADAVGFDFSGATGVGYVSLTPVTGSASSLYTVGAQSVILVGQIGAGFIVTDITVGVQGVAPTPTPTPTATATASPSPTSTAAPPSPTATLASGGPPANVPTLSGWLLAVLALAIATAGLFVIRGTSSTG
jgi:hypothetical protein